MVKQKPENSQPSTENDDGRTRIQQSKSNSQLFVIPSDGFITDSLREEQVENENLRKETRQLREGIAVLQNRLANSGLPVNTSLDSGEVLIPEMSAELLDSLVRENARLKGEVHSLTNSSMMEVKEKELMELKRERNFLAEQVRQLRSIQGASSDAKDAEIARLQEQEQELKGQIQDLAVQCRQLVIKQEEAQTSQGLQNDLQKLNLKECSDELSLLRLRNSTLESEKGQYSSQLKEVVNSNIKWQEYDAEREKYIRKITQEKCELQSILASHNSGMTPSQQVDIDRIITQYKKKVHEAETESQLFEDENRGLRMQVHQLQEAVNKLEMRFSKGSPLSTEERERVAVMESQLQVFREDFQNERKDRERAQTHITELEHENELLQQQLNQFQTAHMSLLAERRTQAMNMYRMDYERQCAMQQNYGQNHPSQLLSRGPSYGHLVADGEEDEDVTQDVVDMPTSTTSLSQSPPRIQSLLECPKCKQQFPAEDPMEFLEHTDKCNS